MVRAARLGLVVGLLGLVCGCGSTTPAGPAAPSPGGFQGEWSGTTFQGLPISFTVSSEQRVTRLTVGYRLDSCVGTDTSTEVLGTTALENPPGLIFSFKLNDSRQVSVQAYRMPDASLNGVMIFVVPRSCGPSETIAGPVTMRR